MTKVVVSEMHGGFGISDKGIALYKLISGLTGDFEKNIDRHDPILVEVVETLGSEASDRFAKLVVREIPGCRYRVDDYDGYETVEYPEMNFGWTVIDTPENRIEYPEYFL